MQCTQCQQDNSPQAKFCLQCGYRFALTCANCNTELPPNAKCCVQGPSIRCSATVSWRCLERHWRMKTMRCGRVTPPLPCRKLTLDAELQNALPPLLSLLDVLPADDPFLRLDPLQRRHRMLDALKRLLLRESQVQPLLLVFEDLHWIDSEMQALLDNLVESLPLAQLLLLVNYRPEYQHGWGSKTYYTQLRLDPLSVSSTDELLVAGDASGAGAGEGVLESSLSCTNEDGQIPARMHPAQASVVGSTACSDADAA